MKHLLAVPLTLIGIQLVAYADTILPGTVIEVRTAGPIMVSKLDRGRIYEGRVARDVYARDGDMAIPRGSGAELIVRQTGPDQMAVDVESITVNGRRYAVDTAGPQFKMPRNEYDNGAGLVGSIVNAIAGAAGGNANVEVRGNDIRVPDGAVLRFRLQEPMHVVDWKDPGYNENGSHYHRDRDWYR
jgi:hypothetical protein